MSCQQISCSIQQHSRDNDVILFGKFTDAVDSPIRYYAASPPDYRASFPGSALPYKSERQAFEGTPNTGIAVVDSENQFRIQLMKPNSYYIVDDLIDPYVNIIYVHQGSNKTLRVKLGNSIQNKRLQTVEFPMPSETVQTQEQLLKETRFCK